MDCNEERPSYYSVIPADVRYDEKLTPNAKLLYGEITALCNKKGYCWATNDYFANLYKVSKVSVSTWIKSLAGCGYISIEIDNSNKENLKRRLSIFNRGIKENFNTGIKENLKYNNTRVNNTSNNTKKENNVFNLVIEHFQSKDVQCAVQSWLDYKKEKGQSYKPRGLTALLNRLERDAKKYGEQYVVDEINYSMSNMWSGIFAQRNSNQKQITQEQQRPSMWDTFSKAMRSGENE